MTGTSNATTATFTLPVATTTNYLNIAAPIDVVDSAANAMGMITYANSSTTVTVWKTTSVSNPFGAFTSSGTKAVDVSHFYQVD